MTQTPDTNLAIEPDLLAVKANAYAKGYAAGRRKRRSDVSSAARRARDDAMWRRAILAALPFAMTQHSWKRGEAPINTMADRVSLAANVADAVLAECARRCR